jgi:hypothetical protein
MTNSSSSTHNGQPDGSRGQDGSGFQPGGGVQPAGGWGQFGGGLNLMNAPSANDGDLVKDRESFEARPMSMPYIRSSVLRSSTNARPRRGAGNGKRHACNPSAMRAKPERNRQGRLRHPESIAAKRFVSGVFTGCFTSENGVEPGSACEGFAQPQGLSNSAALAPCPTAMTR